MIDGARAFRAAVDSRTIREEIRRDVQHRNHRTIGKQVLSDDGFGVLRRIDHEEAARLELRQHSACARSASVRVCLSVPTIGIGNETVADCSLEVVGWRFALASVRGIAVENLLLGEI